MIQNVPLALFDGAENAARTFEKRVNSIYGNGIIDTLRPWLNVSTGSKFSAVWSAVENVYNTLAVIGILMLVLYWFLSIIEKMGHEQMSPEILARSTMAFLVAYMIIGHGFSLFSTILDFSDAIQTNVSTAFTVSATADDGTKIDTMKETAYQDAFGEDIKNQEDAIDDVGKWDIRMQSLELLVPSIIMDGMSAFLIALVIARGIQIIAYTCLAPIAISDMFKGGGFFQSPGWRFIKKYFALAIQGTVLILIIVASNWLIGSVSMADSGFNGIGTALFIIATRFVTVTLSMKSQQFANDIAGI